MARRKSNMNCSLNNLLILGFFVLGTVVTLNYLNPVIEGLIGTLGKTGSIKSGNGMSADEIKALTANDDKERTTNMEVALEQATAAKNAAATYSTAAASAATDAKNATTPEDAEKAAQAAQAAAADAATEAARAAAANTLASNILTVEGQSKDK